MPAMSTIPDSHRDLLDRPVVVSLATVNPDGQPQVTPVWCDYDGEFVRVNSANGRQKVRNMVERPQVTLMALDPNNPYRWLEVRGTVAEIIDDQEQAVAHINKLSGDYRGNPDYYSTNAAMKGKESRIIFRIRPTYVTTGG